MKSIAISIKNLEKSYGSHSILKKISFEVTKGEVVVVIGPSGSGKSTLVRAIAGLETIQSGEIKTEGTVGVVLQHFHLFSHLTALENITLAPRHLLKQDREHAERQAQALLDKLKVGAHASKYPSQLSGGQQQRVAIARALAMEPTMLLFDEPTSALDPEAVFDVLDAIKDLASQGMTMMVVTHQMGFARQVADRVAFLDHGELLEMAPPEQFFTSPSSPRARQFLEKVLRY